MLSTFQKKQLAVAVQVELREEAELAVRAYGIAIGTQHEKNMSDCADIALKKYFNTFPTKSLLAPRRLPLVISKADSW
jgi:hypothetical protein